MPEDEFVLLPYQQAWVADPAGIRVCLKGRRVGLSWCAAAEAVLNAASGKSNTVYMAQKEDLAKVWMRDVVKWCEWLGLTDNTFGQPMVLPGNIQKLRVGFSSGCAVEGLTSEPRSLRGLQADVILDEACFMPDFNEVLRAAMALKMWGGRLSIISTADTEDNPFMQYVQKVKDGQVPGASYHEIDFDTALRQGLYKRRCKVKGQIWTPEGEKAWRKEVIDEHGIAADTELFCQPISFSAGTWFNRANLAVFASVRDFGKPYPSVKRAVRFWDLAATKPSATNIDPDWTRGVLVLELDNGSYMIDDVVSLRDGPAAVEALIKETAEDDGRDVEIGLWQDPGAAGKADLFAKQRLLTGDVVHSQVASKNKLDYAKPWASLVQQGRVVVRRAPWNEEYLRELHLFPGGHHDDAVDATSGAFQVLTGKAGVWAANWTKAWSMD